MNDYNDTAERNRPQSNSKPAAKKTRTNSPKKTVKNTSAGERSHTDGDERPQRPRRDASSAPNRAARKTPVKRASRSDSHAAPRSAPRKTDGQAETTERQGRATGEPQEQRRGRGLRAVVSRTRRQSGSSQTPSSSQARQAKPKSFQQHNPRNNRQNNAKQAGDSCFNDIVTGRFDDTDTVEAKPNVRKRVLAPEPETPKLHKVLAQAGMGSRLEMEQLILEGRISVNSQPAHIGQRIQYGDEVRINGKSIRVRVDAPVARVLAYHKPTGEIVTHDDPEGRPTVFQRLPKISHSKWISIGRLDINTEGLLLFTNSGDLANGLMHPRFGIEREYAVRVLGGLTDEQKDSLLEGIELEDGKACFKSVVNGGGEGANQWYRVVIAEGRNREVRRLIESFGLAVSRLIRIRYGAVVLPAGLKQGHWAELSEDELKELGRLVGGRAEAAIQAGQQGANINGSGGRNQNDRNNRGGNNRGNSTTANRDRGNRTASTGANDRRRRLNDDAFGGQPDPMKTSLGYIEHDAIISPSLNNQRNQRRGAGGGGGNSGNRGRSSNNKGRR